jgi:hypothetical protein
MPNARVALDTAHLQRLVIRLFDDFGFDIFHTGVVEAAVIPAYGTAGCLL